MTDNPVSPHLEKELEKYLKSYSQDPKSRVFVPLGETYRKIGKLDEAISILEEGLKVHPNYASAHLTLGKCYVDKNDSLKAVDEFKNTIKFAPDNIMAYKLMSYEYKKLSDETSLIDTYQRLISISPSDEDAIAFLSEKGLMKKPDPPKKPDPIKELEPKPLTDEIREEKTQPPVENVTYDIPVGDKPSSDIKKPETQFAQPQSQPVIESVNENINQNAGVASEKSLEFYTMTLAEIYLKQGLKKEALEIYEVLSKNNPSNNIYADALAKLKDIAKPVELRAPKIEAVAAQEIKDQALEMQSEDKTKPPKIDRLNNLLKTISLRKRKA